MFRRYVDVMVCIFWVKNCMLSGKKAEKTIYLK
jgi:hypothetical protein